jgi:hypothetical protein
MKAKIFDTKAYLNIARNNQNFSGADGWNDNFVDNDMHAADGSNGLANMEHEAPALQFTIVNNTAGTLSCTLFGASINLNPSVTNFGSSAALTITPDNSVSYYQVLSQSMLEPFRFGKMRVSSTNTTQVQQSIQCVSTNYYGQSLSDPMNMSSTVSAYQNQLTITESTRPFDITGNTYLSFPVLANTTVLVAFFTSMSINAAHKLNGLDSLKKFAAPSTGVRPLLIKTSGLKALGQ